MTVEIRLLGDFEVRVDGAPVPRDAWRRRQAASLVKLLSLAPGACLHREQVIDALWPDLAVDEAAPRLHKAAHYARRALGEGAVVLRGEVVSLVADGDAVTDLTRFTEAAEAALADGRPETARQALALWGGSLLPADPYEPWTEAARDHADVLHQRLLRQAGRLEDLLAVDPTDEATHLALMRSLAEAGDRHGALRQFERLDRVLRRELGVGPSPEAVALRDDLLASAPAPEAALVVGSLAGLVGRDRELAALDATLRAAGEGQGRAVFVSGPPGIGKSALLDAFAASAAATGWRVGRGAAAAIEGAWPYAPALEAFADLCRAHPALLDGLADTLREELEQAMSGRDLDWNGDAGHRRLFVAAAELLRLAAGGSGALLVVDDVHDADEATLRLLHHLVRAAATCRVLVVLAHRTEPLGGPLAQVRSSLLGRGVADELAVGPLDAAATDELVRRAVGDGAVTADVWAASGGVPFAALEAARPGRRSAVEALEPALREVLRRVAVTGTTFDTDVFVAVSGLGERAAFDQLDAAVAAGVVEPEQAGYRFRHQLVRDALLAGMPEHKRRLAHRDAADGLAAMGASPARIGHHLLAAGDAAAAVPYVLRAAQTEAAIGAHRDALALVESVRSAAGGGHAAPVLALRADLLAAVGDARAAQAYRQAIDAAPDDRARRPLRAGLARVALAGGDLDTARAALDGVELDGGPDDGAILLARGNLAYLSGDVDAAVAAADEARSRVVSGDASWQLLDLVGLQGLIAHHRGEWFERLRVELRRTQQEPELARAVFDSHLCVAEYLLYGPTPYDEVVDLALGLKRSAARSGALRAEAFGAALAGEAALLAGDLDAAEAHLQEAVDLHREVASPSGEAHCMQRLAEVRLARGDRAGAEGLLQRALRLARWSSLAMHLVQRIYGTLIAAAPDPQAALAVVDRASAETGGAQDHCLFCDVMLQVPAAVACASAGELDRARAHLAAAEQSARLWDGTAWQAAITEARAHLAAAEGCPEEAAALFDEAARTFTAAGQPLDADRCRSCVAAEAG